MVRNLNVLFGSLKASFEVLNGVYEAVLRIRIRDPVPFWPLYPGFGIGKKSRHDPGEHPGS